MTSAFLSTALSVRFISRLSGAIFTIVIIVFYVHETKRCLLLSFKGFSCSCHQHLVSKLCLRVHHIYIYIYIFIYLYINGQVFVVPTQYHTFGYMFYSLLNIMYSYQNDIHMLITIKYMHCIIRILFSFGR